MSANVARLTPILTDFGNHSADLLVVEYDVPQTKVKQTLFYKYGQLSIPKWALIPAGILGFALLSALLAVILNAILSQPTSTVTYSQACSKTSKCETSAGLICGSASICVCPSEKYWYEGSCVDQPTYTHKCNQTTECRTDLGLVCAEIDGQCNCPTTTKARTCDCPSTSYWTGSTCTPRLTNGGPCTVVDTSYQCLYDLYCNGTMCTCAPDTQYWNGTGYQCFSLDTYLAACDPTTGYSCDDTAALSCIAAGLGAQCPFNATAASYTCECVNGTYWSGGSCVFGKTINIACFWNCECNTAVGLQCLNMSCLCPKKFFWSTSSSSCEAQKDYGQMTCASTSECDTTQGLTCYLSGSTCNCPTTSSTGMCDCLNTQYYDYNLTSCQTLQLYNETCYYSYMCDSSLGLFCQTTLNTALNCSCPEPIRLNMCDCNMSSYWDGLQCIQRLAPNVSCSFEYQCQAGLTCIVNETDIGIFSDVCRCPLGSYYVSGSNCVTSKNYLDTCVGSYQCYESAPLICRYNDTAATCYAADGGSLPSCDCNEDYFYDSTTSTCLALRLRNANCTKDCQCVSPYVCQLNQCVCEHYYSSINQACVDNLQYGDACTLPNQCQATPNEFMTCIIGTCACNSTGVWNGTQCTFLPNFRSSCNSKSDCFGTLICSIINCIDASKGRCACPNSTYFDSVSQSCLSCTGTFSGFTRYVVRYPTTDLCVGVYYPSSPPSISFITASATCATLTAMPGGATPALLSIDSVSDLNCVASDFRRQFNFASCTAGGINNYYYLGYDSTSGRFYDGTYGCAISASLCLATTQCLTFCADNDKNTGHLNLAACSGSYNLGPGNNYYIGAICDYGVN